MIGEHLPGEGMLVTEVSRNTVRAAQQALLERKSPECRNSDGKPVRVGNSASKEM